jgi:NAD(P)-dependent dehydrogenase (short-subunit alcohol dehydrogenase family)
MNRPDLSRRTALVTGASRGLGRSIALELAAAGARLVLVARDLEKLRSVALEIATAGGVVDVFQADITDEAQVEALACWVRERGWTVDIVVNNAGINVRKPLTDFTLEEWRRVVDTNLTSVFLVSRAFIPAMKGRGYGRILNLTSIMSHVAIAGRSAYCASKAGLLGLTKALALELAPEGITVNGISPGPIATEMNTPLLQNPELSSWFLSRIPVGRWGRVDEVGKLALYLCSEDAGFITGTDIMIDGGWTTH